MERREQILDEWLILSCQQGDPVAFEQLVGRWQPRLWRHAWRLLGDEDAAWDALQDSWTAMVRGIGRLHDAAAFPAWAFRIVTNKCRDQVRRNQRRRLMLRESLEALDRIQGDAKTAHARAGDLREALERLPGAARVLLALHYEEGLRLAEIAEILEINEGTVKSRLHQARKLLRNLMEG
jgi:RNA polymerase sigma-70 factor (ECF subfamily)